MREATLQELIAAVFGIGLLVVVGGLLAIGTDVPGEIYAAFAVAVGFIFGSRASTP